MKKRISGGVIVMFLNIGIVASLFLSVLTFFNVSQVSLCDAKDKRSVADRRDFISGRWEIEATGDNEVRLRMQRRDDDSVSTRIPLARLQGLNSAQVKSDTTQVSFQLVRDAGTFTFTGYFRDGRGEGTWTFKGNVAFEDGLRKYGIERVAEEDLCMLALSDVGMAYIRELERAGYHNLTISEMAALFTNDVSIDYIASLESVGYRQLTPQELVSLRSNGISANDATVFSKLVAGNVPAMQLIALKSNGVTERYIRSMQDAGYKHLSARQLISLRANDITRDFVEQLRSRGYDNLSVEELLRRRTEQTDQY